MPYMHCTVTFTHIFTKFSLMYLVHVKTLASQLEFNKKKKSSVCLNNVGLYGGLEVLKRDVTDFKKLITVLMHNWFNVKLL